MTSFASRLALAALFGVAGGGVCTYAAYAGSFPVLCARGVVMGVYYAFGQYYRFAAVEVADDVFRSRAISLVVAGGVIADRTRRHSLVAAAGLGVSATLIAVIGASALPIAGLIAIIAVAGFASGTVAPSRDLIVRSVTPEGSTGKVFAFTSVGLDVGGVTAPLIFGWIMDNVGSRWVFWLAAMIMVCAIATVTNTRPTRRPNT